MLKTHQFVHFLGLLKQYIEKSVRGGYFLPQIMKVAFCACSLSWPPLWLRLGLFEVSDTFHDSDLLLFADDFFWKCAFCRGKMLIFMFLFVYSIFFFLTKYAFLRPRMASNPVFWRRCWNWHFWRLADLSKLSTIPFLQNHRNVRFVEAKRLFFFFAFKDGKADVHKLVFFISQNGRPDENNGLLDNRDEAIFKPNQFYIAIM